MGKVFASNPLSLNVPDPAFESWLRDSGYLEILDTATTTSATAVTTASAKETATATTITHSLLHYLYTFVSLLTVNPLLNSPLMISQPRPHLGPVSLLGLLGLTRFPLPHTPLSWEFMRMWNVMPGIMLLCSSSSLLALCKNFVSFSELLFWV